ncbi:MAG: hypothetical protein OEY85_04850 [Rhodospirillales bacterium]|nr:hypothetical protein [Rhodospirillales bacterium]
MKEETIPPPVSPRSGIRGVVWPALPARKDALLLSLLQQFELSQWWRPEQMLRIQLLQAGNLLQHARRLVPFYRERLSVLDGLGRGKKLTMDEFRRIPLLGKEEIQAAGGGIISRTLPRGHGRMFDVSTSGSTGRPLVVKGTAVTGLYLAALTLRGHHWHRRDFTGRNLTLRMIDKPSPPRPWAPAYRTGPGYVEDISQPVGTILEKMAKIDPHYFQSHPSVLRELIRHSAKTGVRPKSIREVRTYGEAVDGSLFEACMETWGVPVTDIYSAQELNTIAHQCREERNLHVQGESLLVEVLDAGGNPCGPGETGRVVVTTLQNFGTPLIRYDLGDYAEVGGPCPCGRGLLVLKRIVGRERNLVVLPGGEHVHPNFDEKAILKLAPVRQYQLVQTSLENITMTAVSDAPLTKNQMKALAAHFAKAFGHSFQFEFVHKTEDLRVPGKKFELFRSEIGDKSD